MTNKKGVLNPITIGMLMVGVAVLIIFGGVTYAKNGNGFINWFHGDVTSGTDIAPGCSPKKYVAQLHGTLDVINDLASWQGWEIHYVDAHINDISWQPLGIFSNEFEAKVCLYDMLTSHTNPKQLGCEKISGEVTKSRIEKFPFEFKYNLYDNDCNGAVDDHTFNLVAEVRSGDGFERYEKTVTIVNGQAGFQNVEY